jgi:hypothetical protein
MQAPSHTGSPVVANRMNVNGTDSVEVQIEGVAPIQTSLSFPQGLSDSKDHQPEFLARKTVPIEQCSEKDIADAVFALGSAYEVYASNLISEGVDGRTLSTLVNSSGPDVISRALTNLGVLNVIHRAKLEVLFKSETIQKNVVSTGAYTITLENITLERELWLKACLILEVCTRSARPFVGHVMQKLHKKVMDEVRLAIKDDLGYFEDKPVFDDEDWNCTQFPDVDDKDFTENGPVSLAICSFDTDGVGTSNAPHCLKPGSMQRCRLKNAPVGFCEDCVSSNIPLLVCPCHNPSAFDSSSNKSFILLRGHDFTKLKEVLIPFRYRLVHCKTSDPSSECVAKCYSVLCLSRPNYTETLVKSFFTNTTPPRALGDPCSLSFKFWSLEKKGDALYEHSKHSLKCGDIVTFDGTILPHCESFAISHGLHYLVTEASKFSFMIAGPILIPKSTFNAEVYTDVRVDALSSDDRMSFADNPFMVIRRSPVARCRDAARAYHARGSKAELKWSGIRAGRLSGHPGEFCKLFCGQTSRDLDFFEECGTQSGEQLFNMIDCCAAFVDDKDKKCSLFCSLFEVESHQTLVTSLVNLKKAAVGFQISNGSKEPGVKDIRNKMFHDFLTLRESDFKGFLVSAQKFLQSLLDIDSCIAGGRQAFYEDQLLEIDSVAKRNLKSSGFNDLERSTVTRKKQDMLDEKATEYQNKILKNHQEKQELRLLLKLSVAVDSSAIFLREDIQDQLVEGAYLSCTFCNQFVHLFFCS